MQVGDLPFDLLGVPKIIGVQRGNQRSLGVCKSRVSCDGDAGIRLTYQDDPGSCSPNRDTIFGVSSVDPSSTTMISRSA